MAFVTFMASRAGRVVRLVAGLVLVVGGVVASGGWLALAVVGLVPLAAGVFDLCIFAPLVHMPVVGARIRVRMHAS